MWQLEALLLLASRQIGGVSNFIDRKNACSLFFPVHCPCRFRSRTKYLYFLEHLSAEADYLCYFMDRLGWRHTVKKPFCFSFPPENSRIKDRKSRCQYQNHLPAAHRVFWNSPCQKSYGRKIPASNYRYRRKIPRLVTAETAGKSRPVTTDTAGKSRPVTTDTAGKSRPVKTDTAGKSCFQELKKRPESLIIDATEPSQTGCSGAVEEYLVCNLKVEGSPPACAQVFFQNITGKFWWRWKLIRNFRHKWHKLCLLYVWILSTTSGLSTRN